MTTEGYISEIFSSIQGEGGTIKGSCYGKRQIFIRFAGCNLAQGEFDSKGCFWCDSLESQGFHPKKYSYEMRPGTQALKFGSNPADFEQLKIIIESLITPDLHSISCTGGEPLCQLDSILKLANILKSNDLNFPLYLETNGSIIPNPEQFGEIKKHFKYCCCDIKDKSSKAADPERWNYLIDTEITFIKKMIEKDISTFAKIIITAETKIEDIESICQRLSEIKYSDGTSIGLAIQPVYLEGKVDSEKMQVSLDLLNQIFYKAAGYFNPENLSLSIQTHKYLKLL